MPTINFKTKPFQIKTWTILKLPIDVSAKLPSRGQVMIKGLINDTPFKTAVEPDGTGTHWFRIDKSMQKTAKIEAGNTVTLSIESTKDWPEPHVPPDLIAALAAHPQAQKLWERITPMARWEWLRWLGATNKLETRSRRLETACSKLIAGERRPCCFNRSMCCVPDVSKNGVLLEPTKKG